MIKALPDKWIRKAVSDALNGMVVSTIAIPTYDTNVPRNDGQTEIPKHYVLMTTQTADVDRRNKCEDYWESSILLDVVTSYFETGNTGSRLMADDIMDAVRDRVKDLTLDVASGLEIETLNMSFPPDITATRDNENIFRKLMRLELTIK